MALFTDGPINKTLELQNYENRILDVASAEGIDLAGKILLAQDEISNELMMFLLRRLPMMESQGASQWAVRQQTGLGDVAVTSPLRQWHAHKTLALVYRDAYNNQLNDRYQGKWKEYEQLAKVSGQRYFQIGVGLVAGPIARASTPLLTTIAGTGSAMTYYVAVGWVSQLGQEGASSEVSQISTMDGQQLMIAAVNPPANAVGWNIYAGETPTSIGRQNTSPIGITNTWTITGSLGQGPGPSDGQQPSWYLVDQRVIERG
jgi:hypothetical protein